MDGNEVEGGGVGEGSWGDEERGERGGGGGDVGDEGIVGGD